MTYRVIQFIVLLSILSCSVRENEFQISQKERDCLEEIRADLKAERIDISKVEEITSIDLDIDSSIQLNIINSVVNSSGQTLIQDYSETILIEFVKSFFPEKKYKLIQIIFSESKEGIFKQKTNGKGSFFGEEYIEQVMLYLNSPMFGLEEAYEKLENKEFIVYADSLIKNGILLEEAYKYRGISYYSSSDMDKAINDFEIAQSINPKDIDNPMNLAIIYAENENYSKSLKYLSEVLKISPEEPKAIYWKGVCLYRTGEKTESLKLIQHAEELGIREATTFLMLEYKE